MGKALCKVWLESQGHSRAPAQSIWHRDTVHAQAASLCFCHKEQSLCAGGVRLLAALAQLPGARGRSRAIPSSCQSRQEHGDLREAHVPNPAHLLGGDASCSPTRGPIEPVPAVGFSASAHVAEEILWRNFHLWLAKGLSPKNHDLIAVIISIKLSRVFFQWLFKAYLKDIDSSGTPG